MRVQSKLLGQRGNVSCGRALALVALSICISTLWSTAGEAASTTMSWTLGTAGQWASGGVAVRPASGSAIANTNSTNASEQTSTLSWSHEVLSGSNRVLVVGVSVGSTTTVSSVTYASQNLDPVGEKNGVGVRVEMWCLIAPTQGINTVTVTMSSITKVIGGAISFTGVDQDAPLPYDAWGSGDSASPSITVTRGDTDLVLDTVVGAVGTGTLTEGTEQTVRWRSQKLNWPRGGGSTGAETTLARLESISAAGSDDGVVIEWKTEAEVDVAGFNILRGEAAEGPWVKLNQDLIPSRGSSWQGASYTFSDETREAGTVFWYCIEEVSVGGGKTLYPPVLVWDDGLADADGDGMPDLWEKPLGIDNGKPDDADADADGDGSPNLEEYLSGTSPVDAAECPKLLAERSADNSSAILRWIGRPGRKYELMAADSIVELLSGSPDAICVTKAFSNGPMQCEDSVEAGGRMRFYRLIISPPK